MHAHAPQPRQRIGANAVFPHHLHREPYAAIVIGGGYVEAGSLGRWRVGAGDVLMHGPFDAHRDGFGIHGGEIVNLALPFAPDFSAGRITALDEVLRGAERDPVEAALILLRDICPRADPECDWPDLLARDLRADPALRLKDWARCQGLRGESLPRGFFRLYGVTPARYRAQARARKALGMIGNGTAPLADVAAEAGFSDQSHMTRTIRSLTGRAPSAWRGQFRSRRSTEPRSC